jgi:hypothetical protein
MTHADSPDFPQQLEALRLRSIEETRAGAQALNRLITILETRRSGQAKVVAHVVAALCWERPLQAAELRRLDAQISDDVITCIAALRWGRVDPADLLPDGQQRVRAALALWGYE